MQGYLAAGASARRLVDGYEAGGADWRQVEQARFVINAFTSALAPTNTLLGNPAALKRAFETGGRSVVRGLGHMVDDLRHNGGLPTQVDRTAFTVGTDLAVTPGAVVHRDEVMEVIQYSPATPTVRQRPLVIVPPPIGRYYFLDLRPGRSFVEYAVSQGLQVFLDELAQPDEGAGRLGPGHLRGFRRRRHRRRPGRDRLPRREHPRFLRRRHPRDHPVLNHLAATGDDRVHSAGYAVTLLDFHNRAPIGAFSAPQLLDVARRNSGRAGVITARQMGAVFTWMRPDDLIFNYVVNQWLMGEDPPVFDILAWNADGTNLPARLHEQFLDIFGGNSLIRAGAMRVLGTPMHLSRITVPTFVTGALTDHLTPWEGCYRSTQLLSGPTTFVLSNAGHIQSLVNPPGNPKASYWTGPSPDPTRTPGARPPSATRAAGGRPGRSGCCSAPGTRSRRRRRPAPPTIRRSSRRRAPSSATGSRPDRTGGPAAPSTQRIRMTSLRDRQPAAQTMSTRSRTRAA